MAHPSKTQPQAHAAARTQAQALQPSRFAKPVRAVGDPVCEAPEHAQFIPPPPFTGTSLTLSLETILPGVGAVAESAGALVFHALGDTGGIHGTQVQDAIAEAMQAQVAGAKNAGLAPKFLYHLGDVIYFNGNSANYPTQFYEPYQNYAAPIFAIPGNHDGDNVVRPGDPPDSEPSLYGFMLNFCSPSPQWRFKHRATMTQPYCYWKLEAPYAHFLGLYSNIDGNLDGRGTQQQQNWLVGELKATPADKWVIVAVHHPCYSLDGVHGGYEETLTALDAAFQKSGRMADAVFSGHVHNYQRFSRKLGNRSIPYVIAGAGGYATEQRTLHKLQKGLVIEKLPYETKAQGVSLEGYDVTNSGFLRLTAGAQALTIDYFSVSFADPPVVSRQPADSVTVKCSGAAKTAT
jgi:hypothetical protein